MLLKVLLLVSFLQAVESDSSCSKANWWSSFDRKGWSYCANNKHFITGFYRSKLGSWNRDEIYRLEEARCCPSIRRYRSQRSQCVNANWWSSLDKTGTWSSCPSGYFLNGLYRTSGNNLHNIEEGKCCKPIRHPPYYGQCYDEDIRHKFDKAGWTQCEKAGYFVTAVFRDTGTDWLHNVDKLRCCQMGILRQSCFDANWWSSFDHKGWSTCGDNKLFVTGFYRSRLGSWNKDEIYRLEEARCCPSIPRYGNQNSQCTNANWWSSLDKRGTWSKCPSGYFLNGLYRTSGNNLHNIEEGKCCKPQHHPNQHGHCYPEDIRQQFDKAGWTVCTRADHFVAGVYRDTGTDWLHNVDKLWCCQMK